jgi:Subtilisin-like serine proteases
MKKFVLLMLVVAVTLAHADDSKISPELRGYPSTQKAQVIVQYAPRTQVSCGLLSLVSCLLNDILKLGGTILGQLPLVNGVVALLDGNGILNLSNQSNVVYISLDRPLTPSLSNAASAVNAEYAWQSNYTGAGIGVALIDSGVSNQLDLHQGLLSRVVYQQSFVPGNSNPADQYGHGTHIAGLIAGNGFNSTGLLYTKTFKGIAPGAAIVNLRVLDANGGSTDSVVIAAINKAISLKSQYNIRVINLSMGRAVYESYKLDRSAWPWRRLGKMALWWWWPPATMAVICPPAATAP